MKPSSPNMSLTISARLGNDERLLKQGTHRVRRLRTLGDPVLDRRGVKVGLLSDRVVPAELLDRSTVATRARVDGDEAVKRFLLATAAGKTKLNVIEKRAGKKSVSENSHKSNHTNRILLLTARVSPSENVVLDPPSANASSARGIGFHSL